MRSPQTIGEDWPIPFRGCFQTMGEASQWTGAAISASTWPSQRGPRQRGQFESARTGAAVSAASNNAAKDFQKISNRRGSFINLASLGSGIVEATSYEIRGRMWSN